MEFVCAIDVTMGDTAWFADVVLPEATYLEREDKVLSYPGVIPVVTSRKPCIEAMFDSKPLPWIMQELGKRLSKDIYDQFNFTMAEYKAHQLKMRPDIKKALETTGAYVDSTVPVYGTTKGKRLSTKTGKIEIYSAHYAKNGLDPLPVYTPPKPVPKDKYRLVVGRHAYFTQGTTQNNPFLHELMPNNTLWLHTSEARRLGLKDGQMVRVKSPVGEETLHLEVTEKTRPDTVYMCHGFGVLSKGLTRIYGKGGCDANLLEDHVEPISGNMAMHHTFVEIFPA
jgi:thiosulfate reductase/polysulfide reductase chain A